MRTIIFLALVAVAFAAPREPTDWVPIVRQDSELKPDGSYSYSFESGNGIAAEAHGSLKNIGAEESALQIEGQFQYPGDDGNKIQLTYTADENGFHPFGSHLPTSPPIPNDIQRALDYLATAPPRKENERR